jgi:uncharacterized membrane protein
MTRYALFPLLAALSLTACFGDKKMTDAEYDAVSEAPLSAEQFDAVGTEPFWAVQVRVDSLTLSRPDHAELKVAARGPERRGGGLVWTGDGLTVSVVPGACSDGMSDRVYTYQALVRVGPEILKGCAYRPGAAPTATPGS